MTIVKQLHLVYIARNSPVIKTNQPMKKATRILVIVVTSALSVSTLQSQTRPRRVGPVPNSRAEQSNERPIQRPRNRSWTRILGAAISIGAASGGCTPSRDIIRRRPRL